MDKKWINIIGTLATIVGVGATLANNWVEDKKLDEKINEGIDKALAEREEEMES